MVFVARADCDHHQHWVNGTVQWDRAALHVTNDNGSFSLMSLHDGCDGDIEQARRYAEFWRLFLASESEAAREWRLERKKHARELRSLSSG